MNAIDKLKEHKIKIDKRFEEYLKEKKEHVMEKNPYSDDMMNHIAEYNLRGGKRLRPAFMVEGYLACGGTDENSIYDACLAAETMEGYLLIHDDVMDQDDLRRGGTTVHKIYEEFYKNNFGDKPEAPHFGESVAIIAGDVVETFGVDILARANFDAEKKVKALEKYAEIVRYTGFGQLLDVLSEALPVDKVTEEHTLTIHKYKTSIYTIWGPLVMGGILAGASDAQLKSFKDYAIPLGQAFQLQDDMLGMYGDEKKLGKPADSDLKEGKRTVLIIKAMENGNEEQKKKIFDALGNEEATPEMVEEVRQIIKDTGSYEYSKNLAKELAEQGKKAIQQADLKQENKEYLIGIAEYLIDREV